MESKSIMFVINQLDVGGAGKMMKYVANVCANHFERVYILSYIQNSRPVDIDNCIDYIYIKKPNTITLKERVWLMLEIRKKVKEYTPDLVCAFISEVAVMARLATMGLKCKFASAERGDPYVFPFIWRILTRFAYGHSDACFFQLEGARDFYSERVTKKSFVIPNPFLLSYDVEPYYGIRNKTIVGAGRFDKEKRFDLLINAFAQISTTYPNYKLIIFGKGALLNYYKEMISKLGISDKVEFPGYINNVADGVRKEGIFVLTSEYEGIPNVLIEAMSVGIPTISTDCSPGGPSFLSNNGERGIIVPLNDLNAIKEAICSLIENETLYKKLEKNGPHIRKVLDPSVISRQWIDAMNLILK